MYKSKIKRREYVRAWRLKRVMIGHYGECKICKCTLGRNEGQKARNKTGLCRKCNKGENSSNWKGGYINSEGYRVIRIDNGKTMLEHRFVLSKYLGRELNEDETVHHKNGCRDDNRIENLELWVGAPIRGLRIEDAVSWAKVILSRYKDV